MHKPPIPFQRFSSETGQNTVILYNCNDWEKHLLKHHTIYPNPKIRLWWANKTNFNISVISRTLGESVIFAWAISAETNPSTAIGEGAGRVLKTNQHDTTCTGELMATHASLYVLRTIIGPLWNTSHNNITLSTQNSQTPTVLANLWRTLHHNPRWRLNRNWEILSCIQTDKAQNSITFQYNPDDNPTPTTRAALSRLESYLQTRDAKKHPVRQEPNSFGKAYLQKGMTIINDRYNDTIHECYNADDYKSYLCKCTGWSNNTYNNIQWSAFHHEAKKLDINKQTHLLKSVYGWLPIGDRRKAINPRASTKCPSCGSEEAHDHILQCSDPARRNISDLFLSEVSNLCQREKVNGSLAHALQYHIKSWLDQVPQPMYFISDPNIRHAIRDQSMIGWDNFMKGFISNSLQTFVTSHRIQQQYNHYENHKWSAQLIQLLWHHEHDHWKARNTALHGATEEEQYNKLHEQLISEASELYTLKSQLPPNSQKMFKHWQKILKMKNRQLQTWITTTRHTVHYLLDTHKLPDDDPTSSNGVAM